jgi:imidazolonepropionase-like amidohydrolase
MSPRTLVTAASFVDPRSGSLLPSPAILIEDGVIVAVEQGAASADGDLERIDLAGLTLLPGLIDAHVHLIFDASSEPVANLKAESDEHALLRMTVEARAMLHAGITTARDLGDRDFLSLPVRDAIAEGLIEGPRLVCAGPPITTTAGHCWYLGGEVDGEVAIRRAVRERVKRGVDCIKVMATGGGMTPGSNTLRAQFSVAELRAIVDEAHRLGRHVAAHCHGTEGIRNAVEAGVDTLEHCSFAGPDGLDFDEQVANDIAAKGIRVSPTVFVSLARALAGADDPQSRLLRDRVDSFRDRLQRLRQAGARFIASTDDGVTNAPHDALTTALILWVRAFGFPADEVIRAATVDAAETIGVGAITGAVEPGKQADLIAVEGNPLEEIEALGRIAFVMKGGRVARRPERSAVGAL